MIKIDIDLKQLRKYYNEICSKIGDEIGIPLIKRSEGTLYWLKRYNMIKLVSRGSIVAGKLGSNYERMEILVSIGMLQVYIDDINRKKNFFDIVMNWMNELNSSKRSA